MSYTSSTQVLFLSIAILLSIPTGSPFPNNIIQQRGMPASLEDNSIEVGILRPIENESDSSTYDDSATEIEAKRDSSEDAELRDMLCPDDVLQRYDLRIGTCGQLETLAHCGRNMVFTEDSNSSAYGHCECDYESHEVPLVYHPMSNSCYPIYQKAYCQEGEWLIISKAAKGPICESKTCGSSQPEESTTINSINEEFPPHRTGNGANSPSLDALNRESNTDSIFVPINGTGPCAPLGKSSKFCKADEYVEISRTDFLARCTSIEKQGRGLSIISNACPPGSYYSIIGYCQPVWDF